jgi:hypothetical protein
MPILPVRMSGPSSCEWDGTGACTWSVAMEAHPGEGQQDEERGEPFMQVHCTKTVSIRLGSLFLTLPTRGLTEQNFISSRHAACAGSSGSAAAATTC